MSTLLEVQDLRTYFDTADGVVKAVDGVSLQLRRGETLGVVGESGSGKSVLSLSIMRLIQPPSGRHVSGSILFDGVDLMHSAPGALQQLRGNRLAMIFQDPMTALNPFLTVERQLTEVLECHKRLSASAARECALSMLQRVGIPDAARRMGQYPHQFSGGMRQRVMIAMGLLCEPALLIADEPTTALDVTIQAQILELIRSLQRDFGTSVVLITHDLGVVAGMADRIAVMYAGRIVEEAPTEALYRDPRHPYTRGLLRCVPRMEGPREKRLVPIDGLPPDLSALPPGCPFKPRCPNAQDRCAEAYPPVATMGAANGAKRHTAACWRAEDTALQAAPSPEARHE